MNIKDIFTWFDSKNFILWLSWFVYVAIWFFSTSLMVETISPERNELVRWLIAAALIALPCLAIRFSVHLFKHGKIVMAICVTVGALIIVFGSARINTETLEEVITKAQGAITTAEGHKKALEAERDSLQNIANTSEQKISCALITLSDGSTRQVCNDPNKDLRTQKKEAREKIAQINDQLPAFDEEIAKQQKFIQDNDGKKASLAYLVLLADIFCAILIGLISEYWNPPPNTGTSTGPGGPTRPVDPNPNPYWRHNIRHLDNILNAASIKTRERWSRLYPRHNIRNIDHVLNEACFATRKQWAKLYRRHDVSNVDELLDKVSLKTRQRWTRNEAEEAIKKWKKKNFLNTILRSGHGNYQ